VSFSPDGQILAAAMGGVMLWRVTDNEFLREPKRHGDGTLTMAFSPPLGEV